MATPIAIQTSIAIGITTGRLDYARGCDEGFSSWVRRFGDQNRTQQLGLVSLLSYWQPVVL